MLTVGAGWLAYKLRGGGEVVEQHAAVQHPRRHERAAT
jgi:hypothetical protein